MSRRASGFTLLEVLVSVAIFALLAVGAYAVLNQAQQAQAQLDGRAERLAEVQRAINALQQDLEQLALRPTRDEFGDSSPLLKADGSDPEHSSMTFTRSGWRNPIGLPRSSLQHLTWRMDQGKLRREYSLFTDRSPQTPLRGGVMLTRVKSMSLKFLADGDASRSTDWQTSWPANALDKKDTSVPRAAEVSLELVDFGVITRIFRLPETDESEHKKR